MAVKNQAKLVSTTENNGINVSKYWQAIATRKWLMLLLILVSSATTFLVFSQREVYESSTTLVLSSAEASARITYESIS